MTPQTVSAREALPAAVLELLASHGKPMAVREVVRRLGLDASLRRDLKGVLRKLIADGEVVQVHGARVGLPSRMNLVVGRLTANPGGFGFVAPDKATALSELGARGTRPHSSSRSPGVTAGRPTRRSAGCPSMRRAARTRPRLATMRRTRS